MAIKGIVKVLYRGLRYNAVSKCGKDNLDKECITHIKLTPARNFETTYELMKNTYILEIDVYDSLVISGDIEEINYGRWKTTE